MSDATPNPISAEQIAKCAEAIPGLIDDLVFGDVQAMKTFMELSGQKIASINVTQVAQ